MKFKIWDRLFSDIYNLHNKAFDYFNEELFDLAFQYSNEAIKNIPINNSFSYFPLFSKHEVYANLFFIRAKSIEQIEPDTQNNFESIANDYFKTIAYFENSKEIHHTFFSAIVSYSEFISRKCEISDIPSFYLNKAYELLIQGQKASKNISHSLDEIQAVILIQLSIWSAFKHDQNLYFDIEKAIEYLEIAHEYFKKNSSKDYLLQVKFRLAHTHYIRNTDKNYSIDIEKAILYIEEYLEMTDNEDKNLDIVSALLGEILLNKSINPKHVNISAAYETLNFAHSMVSPDKDPALWVRLSVNLIDCLLQRKDWSHYIKDVPDIRITSEDLLKKIFKILDTNFDPIIYYKALNLNRKVSKIYNYYSKGDSLKHLDFLAQKIEGNKQLEGLWIDVQLDYIAEISNSENVNKVIIILNNILSTIDIQEWPEFVFDVYLRLGVCFNGDLNKMVENYEKAMAIFIRLKKERPEQKAPSFRKGFAAIDRQLLTIPYAVLQSGDLLSALKYQEFLSLHSVSDELEDLSIIENQMNRKHWMYKRNTTKIAERVLNTLNSDIEKKQTIDKIENYYKELIELKKHNQEFTSFNFIQNINTNIEKLSGWVLVPIFSNLNLVLVLIPPHSKASDIITSKPISYGWSHIYKAMLDGKDGSWLNSLHYYTARLDRVHEIASPIEKRKAKQEYQNQLESAFKNIQKFLWELCGEWLTSTLSMQNVTFPVDLNIVSQGSLSLLPVGLSRNPNDDTFLFDKVNISYVPSLYALFSLQNRLHFWKEPEKFGFIVDKSINPNDGLYNVVAWPIEKKLSFSAFDKAGRERDSVKNDGLDELRRVCRDTTHWHISAHGKFDYSYFEKSSLKFSNNSNLTPSLLVGLDPKNYLRLVVLSACQTGIGEVLDKELSPESFLTELLKIGTVGAIGTLWKVNEISTAMILGRFYYFHLNRKQEPGAALCSAQKWLRDISYQEFRQFAEQNLYDDDECRYLAVEILNEIENDGKEYPFNHPYYWAGFILVGQ